MWSFFYKNLHLAGFPILDVIVKDFFLFFQIRFEMIIMIPRPLNPKSAQKNYDLLRVSGTHYNCLVSLVIIKILRYNLKLTVNPTIYIYSHHYHLQICFSNSQTLTFGCTLVTYITYFSQSNVMTLIWRGAGWGSCQVCSTWNPHMKKCIILNSKEFRLSSWERTIGEVTRACVKAMTAASALVLLWCVLKLPLWPVR